MESKDHELTGNDYERLKRAVTLLENPRWTAKVTDLIGMPIEWAIERLPKRANQIISKATTKAIWQALNAAVATMNARHKGRPKRWMHKGAVAASGAIGGFFGFGGLMLELPTSTTIMLRSIADIARSEGEDISSVDTQLSCIQVFALGGKSKSDDSTESGYFAIRMALAKISSEAAEFVAEKGIVDEGAPILVKLVARIAARFEVVISEKTSTQIIPVIGAVSGSTINLLFIEHFQSVATGHFIVRSLERKYGEETIRTAYTSIARSINK
jgi:hypothetical protein